MTGELDLGRVVLTDTLARHMYLCGSRLMYEYLSIYLWSGGIAIKAAWFLYRVDDNSKKMYWYLNIVLTRVCKNIF